MAETPELTQFISQLVSKINVDFQNYILAIHGGLRSETPVDTGWAASNWIASVGVPIEIPVGTPEAIDRVSDGGIVNVLSYDLLSESPIFISNNVPYIGFLNYGTSKMAPRNFVERVVNRETAKRAKP